MYKNIARLALTVVLLGTIAAVFFATRLSFNYEFESFFPVGDPELEFYIPYRNSFESDNEYLLLALGNHGQSIFETEFLARSKGFMDSLGSSHLIREIQSPLQAQEVYITPMGPVQVPLLQWDDPEKLGNDTIRLLENSILKERWLSKNADYLMVVIKNKDGISKKDSDALVNTIQDLLVQYELKDHKLAGKTLAQGVYIEKMQAELQIFMSASVILVIFFLIISYRSLWGVIVPLLVVLLSVIWILGIMGLMGKSLDIMLVLLPTIMFVVGMSDVVHILTRYLEELRKGRNKIAALKTTFKEVGLATFLTSLTTSIGFLTLLTAGIVPIREFGVYTAVGVFVAFLLAFSLLPSVLVFSPKPAIAKVKKNRSRWTSLLSWCYAKTLKYSWHIVGLSALILLLSFWGISRIEINSLLLEDIPQNDPLKENFDFFDKEYGGSRPFELAVILQEGQDWKSWELLNKLEKLDSFLQNETGVAQLFSALSVVKESNRALNAGLAEYYRLPNNQSEQKSLQPILQRIEKSGRLEGQLMDSEKGLLRFTGKLGDIGSAISLRKMDEIAEFVSSSPELNDLEIRVTGTSLLIDKNNLYLAKNMFQGLAIAFAVIAIISGLMFKSLRMVLITLVPNIIPLLMVAGIMGFFGISLKLSTSIIFTIAFGIAVDDTIHFISKLRLELAKGRQLMYALRRTYITTGKAIIVTTVILSGGFMTLILSDFGGTFYTGLLVGLTLIFAVVIDLTLLPVLIIFGFKNKALHLSQANKTKAA